MPGEEEAQACETARLTFGWSTACVSERARTCRARHALCTARAARRVRCACSGATLSATATACCRRRRRAAAAPQRRRPRHSATCSAQLLPAASLAAALALATASGVAALAAAAAARATATAATARVAAAAARAEGGRAPATAPPAGLPLLALCIAPRAGLALRSRPSRPTLPPPPPQLPPRTPGTSRHPRPRRALSPTAWCCCLTRRASCACCCCCAASRCCLSRAWRPRSRARSSTSRDNASPRALLLAPSHGEVTQPPTCGAFRAPGRTRRSGGGGLPR